VSVTGEARLREPPHVDGSEHVGLVESRMVVAAAAGHRPALQLDDAK
jgi:hypothetical protein